MHVVNFKGELVRLLHRFEKMVVRSHIVPLIPVRLPLPKDREPWLYLKLDVVLKSLGVGGADVANVIVVVQSCDILGQLGGHGTDGISSLVWVDLWLIVDSRELTVNTGSIIMQVEILIDCDVSPMRNIDVSFGFCDSRKRVLHREHQLNLVKSKWLYILVWAVSHSVVQLIAWLLRLEVELTQL